MADDSAKKISDDMERRLHGLEKWLDGIFGNKFPVQLPAAAREWIVKVAPWLALIGGILSLWASWNFWQAGHYINRLVEWTNTLSATYGGTVTAAQLGFMWYLALVTLVIQAVLLLLAFSSLRERKKRGWNLVFYSSLVGIVLGLVQLFVSGYGLGSLVGNLIGAAISMFILFQVRSYYKGA